MTDETRNQIIRAITSLKESIEHLEQITNAELTDDIGNTAFILNHQKEELEKILSNPNN